VCGIAGIWAREAPGDRAPRWTEEVRAMLGAIRHRGPDGERVVAGSWGVLGACRLAVLDLARGAQPMRTSDGRSTLALNGEIVNHVELRARLEEEGAHFRTHCDTEVLLELLARRGAAGLAQANGMFAGAFCDEESGEVLLFRDPCGVKPLSWLDEGDRVLFASEPKALLAAARRRPGLDRAALLDYIAFQMPLTDATFFAGVRRLPPGGMLRLSRGAPPRAERLPDWDGALEVPGDPDRAAAALAELLRLAVRDHLRSDVPVGAHLSGGVDSSLVASLASRELREPLHVFTGAFDVPGFDEREHARAVATEIGAVAHETVMTPEDLAEALPRAVRMMDEPMAGPGLLPQWHVSRLAAQHVKVVLGGHGGDEVFSGYVRHLVIRYELALEEALRGGRTQALRALAPHLGALDGYAPLLRRHFAQGLFEPVPDRYFALLHRGSGLDAALSGDLRDAVSGDAPRDRFLALFAETAGSGSQLGAAARFDRRVFLPSLLEVEDRSSMAWSIESRVPLLDRRVLAFVERCPDEILLGDGELKHLLRRAACEHLPRAARERTTKMGFPVPLATWARGPLRDFFHDLLLDGTARSRGLYDAQGVERVLAGDAIEGRHLWALVNVELWHRAYAA
jgi:asparagine synthase (glutamine-hydrolysing)